MKKTIQKRDENINSSWHNLQKNKVKQQQQLPAPIIHIKDIQTPINILLRRNKNLNTKRNIIISLSPWIMDYEISGKSK
jgi:hypothetical protein